MTGPEASNRPAAGGRRIARAARAAGPEAPEARGSSIGGGAAGALAGEVVGTYLLVFIGTGTVLATAQLAGEPDITAVSLAFGFAVLIAVYAFGHTSGAHINPAVTLGLAVVRKFPWSAVPGYVAAQLVGALLAALTTWLLFGGAARRDLALAATAPGERGSLVALVAEFVITFLLMVTVLTVAADERSPGAPVAGLAIGLVVAAAIFVTLPVSGGSLNPARTFGPMIVAGQFPGWWVYLIGPPAGAVAGALTWQLLLRRGQPPGMGRQG